MKIKTKVMDYDRVLALPRPGHLPPLRPGFLFRLLIRAASVPELRATRFSWEEYRMEEVKDQPCLILMNHSCFLDLSIVSRIFFPRPYCIVCTSDGFVGKRWLMRHVGCIPTRKFVTDLRLVQDMTCALKERGCSVLMYPEASYSFDGTATPLPRKMGVLLKKLDVPVVMITTRGAFARDPLYNGLQKRRVSVTARAECLFTRQELKDLSVGELSNRLDRAFTFDNFRWQQETGVEIHEPFRADGLNRILYRCAHCGAEGHMEGKGTGLTCGACGKHYELTPLGRLEATEGETEFPHIPDWYAWEREQVRRELLEGTYRLEAEVDIGMMVDYKAIYMVGKGYLTHAREGFTLTGCDGRLRYSQKPLSSYGLYADYFWYEIGDVICIGDRDCLYYCFPRGGDVVAKTRLAAEELYKLLKARTPLPTA